METQYRKAYISNKLVEITHHSNPPPTKHSLGGRKPSSKQSVENYESNQKISINRARKNIRRLLECNFTDQYAFVTLTFRNTTEVDVTDIKSCNKVFTDFKKRLTYYLKTINLPPFKYLGVTEFQDNNREGTVHYHLICNLTEVSVEILQNIWKHGWVNKRITTSNAVDNKKIALYLNKGITDPRLNGHKRYFHSHGLKKPTVLEIKNLPEFYEYLNKCKASKQYGETYLSRYTGESNYEEYYVENAKELHNYVQEI